MRRAMTRSFVDQYLRDLRFGNTVLRIAEVALRIPRRTFKLPDLRFGKQVVLSARASAGAVHASLHEFGKQKLRLLKEPTAGFYDSAPLDRQYLILPRSIYDSFGGQFINELSDTLNEFFPHEEGYRPEIVVYDDHSKGTFVHQALALRKAIPRNAHGRVMHLLWCIVPLMIETVQKISLQRWSFGSLDGTSIFGPRSFTAKSRSVRMKRSGAKTVEYFTVVLQISRRG